MILMCGVWQEPDVAPSHRISQMFLNAKTSKRKTERVEDDAEEDDLNAMLDTLLNDPTAVDLNGPKKKDVKKDVSRKRSVICSFLLWCRFHSSSHLAGSKGFLVQSA